MSRPLLFGCDPEPLQGRLCAGAISGDPFLPQVTHPGVTVGMSKEEQSGNCLQCTRRKGRHCVGRHAQPNTEILLCGPWGPGLQNEKQKPPSAHA